MGITGSTGARVWVVTSVVDLEPVGDHAVDGFVGEPMGFDLSTINSQHPITMPLNAVRPRPTFVRRALVHEGSKPLDRVLGAANEQRVAMSLEPTEVLTA